MRKYEVKEAVTLTAQKGSVVILSEEQAKLLGVKVSEVKEKKSEGK